MDSPLAFETLFGDDVATVYRHRALITLVWRQTPTVSRLGQIDRTITAAVRAQGGDVVMCTLAQASSGLPDAETRRAMTDGIKRLGPVRAVANVILGSGFQAAAMRSLLSGFSLIVRPKYPVAFVGSESEAASFLVPHWPDRDPPSPDRIDLGRALRSVAPKRV